MIQIEALQDFVKEWNRNVVAGKIEEIYADVPNIKSVSSKLIQNVSSAIDVYKIIGRSKWRGMIPKNVEIMILDKKKLPQHLLFVFRNNNREISNFIFCVYSDFVQILELKSYIQKLNAWIETDQIKTQFPKIELDQPIKEIKSFNRLRKAYEAITKHYVWPYMLPKSLETLIKNGNLPLDIVEEAGGSDHESVLNFICNYDDIAKLKALRDFVLTWNQMTSEERKQQYKSIEDAAFIKINSFRTLRDVVYTVGKKEKLNVMSPRRLEYLAHTEIPQSIAAIAGSDFDSLLTFVGAKMSIRESFFMLVHFCFGLESNDVGRTHREV